MIKQWLFKLGECPSCTSNQLPVVIKAARRRVGMILYVELVRAMATSD